jgi:hypothetical protein
MTDGAHTPPIRARPDQSANLTDHTAGSEPAPAKPCQKPFTGRQIGPLEQAGRRPGEFLRLGAAWLAGHVAVQLDLADVHWLRACASGETARAA